MSVARGNGVEMEEPVRVSCFIQAGGEQRKALRPSAAAASFHKDPTQQEPSCSQHLLFISPNTAHIHHNFDTNVPSVRFYIFAISAFYHPRRLSVLCSFD